VVGSSYWTNIGDKTGFGVASQAIFQKKGKLRVAVMDMANFSFCDFNKCVNYVSKYVERLIDVAAFF